MVNEYIKVGKEGLLINLPLDQWKENGKNERRIFLEPVPKIQQVFEVNK